MGCWTNIVDENGRTLVIRTGRDNYDTYRIGDEVAWSVSKTYAGDGTLLDDVYLAERWPEHWPELENTREDVFVVIREHKVLRTHPAVVPEGATRPDDADGQAAALWLLYGIVPLDPRCWPSSLWEQRAVREEEARRRDRHFLGRTYGMTVQERAGFAMAEFVKSSMREDSFFEQVMPKEQDVTDAG